MTFSVEVVADVEYAAPDGVPLLADLYVPRDVDGDPPVIIWLHGGGWRFGHRRLAPDLTRLFAASGFVMVSVDYRLTGRARFPAQIQDVKTAIRWVRHAGPRYGVTGSRIGLFGSSAGGHLAALAALAPDSAFPQDPCLYAEQSSEVAAVVDGYGPTDFLQIDAHRLADDRAADDPETLLLPRGVTRSAAPDSFESLLVGAPIETCPDRVRYANPITFVRPDAPPFLILHGLSDTTVPPHQSELLYDALATRGNDVTLCLIERLGHGFLVRTHLDDGPARARTVRHSVGGREQVREETGPLFPMIEAFFRRHLGAADAAAAAAPGDRRDSSA